MSPRAKKRNPRKPDLHRIARAIEEIADAIDEEADRDHRLGLSPLAEAMPDSDRRLPVLRGILHSTTKPRL